MPSFTSLFDTLKHRVFFKREQKLRRRVSLIFIGLFLLLNLCFYFALYYDLHHFALTVPTSSQSDLLTTYSLDPSPTTTFGYVFKIEIILIFLAIELFAFWYTLKAWGWKLRTIIKKTFVLTLFHLFYLLPIFILFLVPSRVSHNLQARARAEVSQLVTKLQNQADSTVSYGTPAVLSQLRTLEIAPSLVEGPFTQVALLSYLDLQDRDTYYRQIVMPLAIYDSKLELSPLALLFPSHLLVLPPSLSRDDLEDLLLEIALQTIQSSSVFDGVKAKAAPQFTLLDESEYLRVMNTKLALQKKKFEQYLRDVKTQIEVNNTYLKSSEAALSQLEQGKVDYESRVRPLLSQCFVDYSVEECQEPQAIVDQSLRDYDSEINETRVNLAKARDYVPFLDTNYQNTQESYAKFLTFPIIPELQAGIFDPPAKISLKYMGNPDPLLPSNYLYTLIHELLHYYSYNYNSELPSFLEEGITDYLSSLIGTPYLDQSFKLDGYPDEILLVQALVERMGEDKLVELYFSKNPKSWQTGVDSICGKSCYPNLVKLGEQITYTPVDELTTRADLVTKALKLINSGN